MIIPTILLTMAGTILIFDIKRSPLLHPTVRTTFLTITALLIIGTWIAFLSQ